MNSQKKYELSTEIDDVRQNRQNKLSSGSKMYIANDRIQSFVIKSEKF